MLPLREKPNARTKNAPPVVYVQQLVFPDMAPPVRQSSHEKGKELEQAFGNWLSGQNGYETIRLRNSVVGRVTIEEPDIHASRTECHTKSRAVSRSYIWGGLLLAASSVFVHAQKHQDAVTLFFLAGGTASLAYYFLNLSGSRTVTEQRHVWAECKNWSDRVDKQCVQVLIQSVWEVRSSPVAQWKPDLVMLVAAKGFTDPALALARKEGIECYVPDGGGFLLVK